MSNATKIEWTDATWNPVRGCSRVSSGCKSCYAERMAARFGDPGQWGHGFAETRSGGPHWTGKVELIPHKLTEPLHWKKPRRIFVNSTSDLFHESLSFEAIASVFGVMAVAHRRGLGHVFQVLTKRADRAREWFEQMGRERQPHSRMHEAVKFQLGYDNPDRPAVNSVPWPLPNVHLGVSVEDQPTADERLSELMRISAAVRFVSAEPLLGPVKLRPEWWPHDERGCGNSECEEYGAPSLDWVIVGGESGPNARPMHPDWARSIRDQCVAAGVPFFFKQWGEWRPYDHDRPDIPWDHVRIAVIDRDKPTVKTVYHVGKKRAGRLLDGVEWSQFPEVRS